MAVIRRYNVLGQERVDVPHIRLIEEGVAGDFDALAGQLLAGGRPMVIRGFQLVFAGISAATLLELSVASGVLLHPTASEGGTILAVPPDRPVEVLGPTNPRVQGGFLPSSVNFVGIDLLRQADDTTADVAFFLDSTSGTETPKTVDLARTLDYRIVISTQDFAINANLAPAAIVTTDASGNVTSVQDARSLMFRLGTGSTSPDPLNAFGWPGGRVDSTTDFAAGDRSITELKAWLDAVMSRLWEIGGGERWFSGTADRNMTLTAIPPTFTSSGENFEWDGTNLHWKGLAVIFDNSTGRINEVQDQVTSVSGQTDLADGDCVYIDLDRTQNRTGGTAVRANRSALVALGQPAIPGSRLVLAWRRGSQVYYRGKTGPIGSFAIPAATTLVIGAVLLSGAPPVVGSPVVATLDVSNRSMTTGITRAGSLFGNGTVFIGPNGANDTAILYGSTTMAGGHTFDAAAGVGTAVLTRNNTDVAITATTQIATWAQNQSSVMKNLFRMMGSGALEMSLRLATPATPATDVVALSVTTNGLSTPNRRLRLAVRWPDGSETILAEGPAS